MERVCPSCGLTEDAPDEALGTQAVCICTLCGWVNIWERGAFRAPTETELTFIGGNPYFLVDVGRGAIERQARVMGVRNA